MEAGTEKSGFAESPTAPGWKGKHPAQGTRRRAVMDAIIGQNVLSYDEALEFTDAIEAALLHHTVTPDLPPCTCRDPRSQTHDEQCIRGIALRGRQVDEEREADAQEAIANVGEVLDAIDAPQAPTFAQRVQRLYRELDERARDLRQQRNDAREELRTLKVAPAGSVPPATRELHIVLAGEATSPSEFFIELEDQDGRGVGGFESRQGDPGTRRIVIPYARDDAWAQRLVMAAVTAGQEVDVPFPADAVDDVLRGFGCRPSFPRSWPTRGPSGMGKMEIGPEAQAELEEKAIRREREAGTTDPGPEEKMPAFQRALREAVEGGQADIDRMDERPSLLDELGGSRSDTSTGDVADKVMEELCNGAGWMGTPPAEGTRRHTILKAICDVAHPGNGDARLGCKACLEAADAIESALLKATIEEESDRPATDGGFNGAFECMVDPDGVAYVGLESLTSILSTLADDLAETHARRQAEAELPVESPEEAEEAEREDEEAAELAGQRSGKTEAMREKIRQDAATPADAEGAIAELEETGRAFMLDGRHVPPGEARPVPPEALDGIPGGGPAWEPGPIGRLVNRVKNFVSDWTQR